MPYRSSAPCSAKIGTRTRAANASMFQRRTRVPARYRSNRRRCGRRRRDGRPSARATALVDIRPRSRRCCVPRVLRRRDAAPRESVRVPSRDARRQRSTRSSRHHCGRRARRRRSRPPPRTRAAFRAPPRACTPVCAPALAASRNRCRTVSRRKHGSRSPPPAPPEIPATAQAILSLREERPNPEGRRAAAEFVRTRARIRRSRYVGAGYAPCRPTSQPAP